MLDLIGVFAFAYFGASSALAARFNFWGVAVCGFLTALGGGTIRQALLHNSPAYLEDPAYLSFVLAAVVFAIVSQRHSHRLKTPMLVLDAIGLAAFAYIGATAAKNANLGIEAIIGFALLTAVGGGIITDIIVRQTPQVFRSRSYIIPVILMGGLYWALGSRVTQPIITNCLLLLAFGVRVISLLWGHICELPQKIIQLKTSDETAAS